MLPAEQLERAILTSHSGGKTTIVGCDEVVCANFAAEAIKLFFDRVLGPIPSTRRALLNGRPFPAKRNIADADAFSLDKQCN